MPKDQRLGEAVMQLCHQFPKCLDLLWRARVNLTPQGIKAPLIADADRVSVMPHDMSTRL